MADKPKRHVRPIRTRGRVLCVMIPADIAKRLAWNYHDAVAYDVIDGSLVLTKVKLPSVPDFRLRVDESERAG